MKQAGFYPDLVYEMSSISSEEVLRLLDSDEPVLDDFPVEFRLKYAGDKVGLARQLRDQSRQDIDEDLSILLERMANEYFIRAKLAYKSIYQEYPVLMK